MNTAIDIKGLSRVEKIQVMETLWEDLSKDDEKVASPSWHQKYLQETENQLCCGDEKIVDWHVAKKELMDRFE